MSSCSSSSATAIAGMACFSPTRSTTRNVFLIRSSSLSSLSPNWVLGKKFSTQKSPSFSHLFLRFPGRSLRPRRPVKPVMEWQDCSVKMEIDVPVSVAYNCYSDRESIPKWMPFISTVKILEDKPDLSRWSLKYKALGRDIEFSWLARNMQPITNQKIHWRSMEGLPNRGAVRFYPKGPSSCTVELTVSYEVPQILTPVASALKPLLEELLRRGLERFATFAKSYA